jgi:uncharacterized membrane protein
VSSKEHRFWRRLRNLFIAGLVILTPVVVTIYVFIFLFLKVDSLLGPLILRLVGLRIPGMGFLAVLVLIFFTGLAARNYLGGKLIGFGEKILTKIPFINRIYVALQQISHAFLAQKRAIFKEAVLVEYPRKGIYAIGFVTSQMENGRMLSIFLPTTPNPTSGYLLFLPREEAIPLQMTIEEALKLVISGGAVAPEGRLWDLQGREVESGDEK